MRQRVRPILRPACVGANDEATFSVTLSPVMKL